MEVTDEKSNGRNRSFALTGHFMTAFFLLSFALLFINNSRKLDFWQEYFYGDSQNINGHCQFASNTSSTTIDSRDAFAKSTFQDIKVPHKSDFPKTEIDPAHAYRNILYRCKIGKDKFDATNELAYFHASWVFGEQTTVFVNGTKRLSFLGNDKPAIPLSADDLSQDVLKIDILVSAKKDLKNIGLQGSAPSVLSFGKTKNFKVFGIETALQNVRYLINVLPLMTLSLVLSLGWFIGIRSRLILTVFMFFGLAISRNFLILFSDLLPFETITAYYLFSSIFEIAVNVSLFVFGLEFIRFGFSYINWITRANFLALAVLSTMLVTKENPKELAYQLLDIKFFLTMIGSILIISIISFKLKKQKVEAHLKTPAFSLACIYGILALSTIIDKTQVLAPVYLAPKIDVFMPLAIGAFIFLVLKRIQDRYQVEKDNRKKIELDLELAKEIQDSLAPPPPRSQFGSMQLSCYQIKHSQVAGDWMAVRQDPDKLVIALTDVTGKGIQAALVVHAIQSLWAEALTYESLHVEYWIRKLNRTLNTLGERRPHSGTAGVLVVTEEEITYWSLGHIPVFAVVNVEGQEKVKVLNARGSIMGLNRDAIMEPITLEISEYSQFDLYLGSDGIFDKGSRTRPRDVVKFHHQVAEDVQNALDHCDLGDDRTLIHLSRQMLQKKSA